MVARLAVIEPEKVKLGGVAEQPTARVVGVTPAADERVSAGGAGVVGVVVVVEQVSWYGALFEMRAAGLTVSIAAQPEPAVGAVTPPATAGLVPGPVKVSFSTGPMKPEE